jgi:hypothetical protein
MTFLTTAQSFAALDSGGYMSISEDTGSGVIVASSAQPYDSAAVRRILRAKSGPVVRAPDKPNEFLAWLER